MTAERRHQTGIQVRLFEFPTRQRRHFARQAENVGIAGVVGQDADFEHGIAHVIDQRRSGDGVIIKEDHAFVFFADAQFLFGADHRVRVHAADFGAFERGQHQAVGVTVINGRAFFGVCDFNRLFELADALVRVQVWRAGQDDMAVFAIEQVAERQPVGVGVRVDFVDFGHDQFFAVPGDAADFESVVVAAGQRQTREADVVNLQPGGGQDAGQVDDFEAGNIHIIF